MANLKVNKVNTLPGTLEADSIYFERVNSGFNLWVTDNTGTPSAFSTNQRISQAFMGTGPFTLNGGNNAVNTPPSWSIDANFDDLGLQTTGADLTPPAGRYRIDVSLNTNSTNTRMTLAIELVLDGVPTGDILEPQNYARVSESNNEAGMTGFFIANVTGNVSFNFIQRSGGNGGTNTFLSTSKVIFTAI